MAAVKDALFRVHNAAPPASAARRTTRSKLPVASDPVVHSPAMQRVYETVRAAAGKDSSVLLLGESGTREDSLWPTSFTATAAAPADR